MVISAFLLVFIHSFMSPSLDLQVMHLIDAANDHSSCSEKKKETLNYFTNYPLSQSHCILKHTKK